ncbi:hypothetical protein BH10PLA2_BH10PLA2_12250 [soil metagenome]
MAEDYEQESGGTKGFIALVQSVYAAVFFLLFVAVIVVGLFKFLINTANPLPQETRSILATLDKQRTICEKWVIVLKAKGIDGQREYEKAQLSANSCIDYLKGVLDSPPRDQSELSTRVTTMETAASEFVSWANQKLLSPGQIGANVIDASALLKEILVLLNDQEQARRKEVKKSLDEAKFKRWDEIGGAAPTGALSPLTGDLPRP